MLAGTLRERWRLRRQPGPPFHLFDRVVGERHTKEAGADIPAGTLDTAGLGPVVSMDNPASRRALPYGWYGSERHGADAFCWSANNAAVVLRVLNDSRALHLRYRLYSTEGNAVRMTLRSLNDPDRQWALRSSDGTTEWRNEVYDLEIPPGDYTVLFDDAGRQRPPGDPRELGLALRSAAVL
jgi:hypothetical protein